MTRFKETKKIYEKVGVDVEGALASIKNIPVAMHCWGTHTLEIRYLKL